MDKGHITEQVYVFSECTLQFRHKLRADPKPFREKKGSVLIIYKKITMLIFWSEYKNIIPPCPFHILSINFLITFTSKLFII